MKMLKIMFVIAVITASPLYTMSLGERALHGAGAIGGAIATKAFRDIVVRIRRNEKRVILCGMVGSALATVGSLKAVQNDNNNKMVHVAGAAGGLVSTAIIGSFIPGVGLRKEPIGYAVCNVLAIISNIKACTNNRKLENLASENT